MESSNSTGAPTTILLVDDDPDQLDLLTTLLEFENFAVIPAESGQKGLEILSKQKVDAVVTDICMPEMSGVDFASKIRTLLGNKVPRIVLLTAGIKPINFSAVNFKADGFYLKQNLQSTLVPALHSMLADSPAVQQ